MSSHRVAERAADCALINSYTMSYSGRRFTLITVGAALVAAFLTGCSGSDDAQPLNQSAGPSTSTIDVGADLIGPDEFAALIVEDAVVVNVHIPYEGHIDGTDAFVPFDAIDEWDALPADRSTPIAVYCRSGNMSASASEDLIGLGYTNVVDLAGGMNAWAAAGRPLEES